MYVACPCFSQLLDCLFHKSLPLLRCCIESASIKSFYGTHMGDVDAKNDMTLSRKFHELGSMTD